MTKAATDLREEILKSVARYYEVAHADRIFVRGKRACSMPVECMTRRKWLGWSMLCLTFG